MDMRAHEVAVIQAEARDSDSSGDHTLRETVKVLVVRAARGTHPGKDSDQRGLAAAAGATGTLSIVARAGRDIPQHDGVQMADVNAQLHCGRADEHVQRIRRIAEAQLDIAPIGSAHLSRMLLGAHLHGLARGQLIDLPEVIVGKVTLLQLGLASGAIADAQAAEALHRQTSWATPLHGSIVGLQGEHVRVEHPQLIGHMILAMYGVAYQEPGIRMTQLVHDALR